MSLLLIIGFYPLSVYHLYNIINFECRINNLVYDASNLVYIRWSLMHNSAETASLYDSLHCIPISYNYHAQVSHGWKGISCRQGS